MSIQLNPDNLWREGLQKANQECGQQEYRIVGVNWKPGHNPKEYIILALQQEGKPQVNIGCTHIVHLKDGKDKLFKDVDWTEIARSVDEIKDSILKVVSDYFEAVKNGYHITINGTKFKVDHLIQINKEGKLYSCGVPIVQSASNSQQQPIPLTDKKLFSESIFTFKKTQNGLIEFVDPLDQRKGCGIFADPQTGIILRA